MAKRKLKLVKTQAQKKFIEANKQFEIPPQPKIASRKKKKVEKKPSLYEKFKKIIKRKPKVEVPKAEKKPVSEQTKPQKEEKANKEQNTSTSRRVNKGIKQTTPEKNKDSRSVGNQNKKGNTQTTNSRRQKTSTPTKPTVVKTNTETTNSRRQKPIEVVEKKGRKKAVSKKVLQKPKVIRKVEPNKNSRNVNNKQTGVNKTNSRRQPKTTSSSSKNAKTIRNAAIAGGIVVGGAVVGGDAILNNVKGFLDKGNTPILERDLKEFYKKAMNDDQYSQAAKLLASYAKKPSNENLKKYNNYVQPFANVATKIQSNPNYGIPKGTKVVSGKNKGLYFGGYDLSTGEPIYYSEKQQKNVSKNKPSTTQIPNKIVTPKTSTTTTTTKKQTVAPTTTKPMMVSQIAPTPTPTPVTAPTAPTAPTTKTTPVTAPTAPTTTPTVIPPTMQIAPPTTPTTSTQQTKASTVAPTQKATASSPIEAYMSMLQGLPQNDPSILRAKKEANQMYQGQLAGLNTREKQLQELKNADVGLLQQNQQLAQKQLNDNMFQQYLQTQENMNSRGLMNSGLRQDANVRLDMTRQDALANLYARTQGEMNRVNQMYSPQMAELSAQKQSLSPEMYERQLIGDLNKERMNQANAYSKILPYTSLTANQQAQTLLQQQKMQQTQANSDRTYALKLAESKKANEAGASGGVEGQMNFYGNSIKSYQEDIANARQVITSKADDTVKQHYQDIIDTAQKEINYFRYAQGVVMQTGQPINDAELRAQYNKINTTPKRKEVKNKDWGNRDYLQGVLNDPLYVNALAYGVGSAKPESYASYGKDLSEGDWGMSPTLAAMRLVDSGIKPTLSQSLLKKYKDVSEGKGGGLLGVSAAEEKAAKAFLEYYKKNSKKFNVK